MFTKKITSVLVLFIFILPGTLAYAHAKNQDAAAFFFLEKTDVNLPQLIENVEKSQNGQVIAFKVEKEKNHAIQYEMRIWKDGKIVESELDPTSGKVLKTESEGLFSRFFGHKTEKPATTKLSLKDAVSSVETRFEGKILAGALQNRSSVDMFRIKVANSEGAFTVMVDANSGALYRASSREDGDHHRE